MCDGLSLQGGLGGDEEEQPAELSEDQVQRLESLGYLSFAPKADPEAASSVIVRKAGCSCSGYLLLT